MRALDPYYLEEIRRRNDIATRYRAWQEAIQPFIRQKVRWISLCARPTMLLHEDGRMEIQPMTYPPEVQELFKLLDEQIEGMAKAYGFKVQALEDGQTAKKAQDIAHLPGNLA